jgi:hypothetical protein
MPRIAQQNPGITSSYPGRALDANIENWLYFMDQHGSEKRIRQKAQWRLNQAIAKGEMNTHYARLTAWAAETKSLTGSRSD